jgi:hypothetical protein
MTESFLPETLDRVTGLDVTGYVYGFSSLRYALPYSCVVFNERSCSPVHRSEHATREGATLALAWALHERGAAL